MKETYKKVLLVVDCFNLIYKFPELEERMYRDKLDEAKIGILDILLQYKQKTKKDLEIHAFFDGRKAREDFTTEGSYNGIFTYYSLDKKADDLIKKFIRFQPMPSLLNVITSDKEILGYCKKFKCQSQTSEDFATLIEGILQNRYKSRKDEKPIEQSQEELSYWKKIFEI